MKKYLLFSVFVFTVFISCSEKYYPYRGGSEKYKKLVWHDEFNGKGLPNVQKWSYEEGYIRNHELQYYTVNRPENARQENG
ncbi:MAG: hypothetical protein LBG92_07070, partial [Prevotellaceae bacterium]|jgi:hypothetical protein|nr:hypothetical protein [Prevotellaceae bacterium]